MKKTLSVEDGWMLRRLHDAGYRLTTPREIILSILSRTDRHLSAEDIYLKAVKETPQAGLTTVYRTLDLLNRIGMVQRIDFGEKKARYELSGDFHPKEHHHHLVCVRCKNIVDYSHFLEEEIQLMQKTEKELSRRHNFKIMHHAIHFYGVCGRCLKKEREKSGM